MRWPVRLRLALSYGAAFLAAAIFLVALIGALVLFAPFPPAAPAPAPPGGSGPVDASLPITAFQEEAVRRLVASSAIALAVMAVLALLLGWFMAGRALRPVAVMTATVRRMTADRLDRRLAVQGPEDELKELADTFDELMDRLQGAFTAQRRFIANASHELRTPLTLQQTLAEVALADEHADAGSLRTVLHRVVAAGRDQERLIEALLTLARSQQGLHRRQDCDLAALTADVLSGRVDAGVRVEARLSPASVSGDPALLERLVTNLLDNATRHNVPDGWATVVTGPSTTDPVADNTVSGRSVLRVTNSGPVIGPHEVRPMLEPFQRLGTGPNRGPSPRGDGLGLGLGLGLSIVAAIVEAHRGTLDLRPRPDGGLEVTVTFGP